MRSTAVFVVRAIVTASLSGSYLKNYIVKVIMMGSGRNNKLEWYAYEHVNGTKHLRRFLGDVGDIQEARDSDFVKRVTGPFEAKNRPEAMSIMLARLGK